MSGAWSSGGSRECPSFHQMDIDVLTPPTCAVCLRPVERIEEVVDAFGRLRLTVTCHGHQETVTFDPGEDVRGIDLGRGLAFVPRGPARLGA